MKTRMTSIEGVVVFEPVIHRDARGLFFEAYKEQEFARLGLPTVFLQDNISQSKKGVVRGLHYQRAPMSQGKLIRCLKGSIFDVAVDMRLGSPTFGRTETILLSDKNHLALYIPPGLAHGFQALAEDTIIHYKCTEVYSKEHEVGIHPFDKFLDIQWPLEVSEILEQRENQISLEELIFRSSRDTEFRI